MMVDEQEQHLNYVKKQLLDCLHKDNVEKLADLHWTYPDILNFPTKKGYNSAEYPIHEAARYDSIHCMQYILENDINPNQCGNCSQERPIQIAIEQGQYDIMCLLLSYGANPNAVNCVEHTALMRVATSKLSEDVKLKMARKLIEYGANPCVYGMFGKGEYGTKQYVFYSGESRVIFLSLQYIAKYNEETNFYQYLCDERTQWLQAHPKKNCWVKLLNIVGNLLPKSQKKHVTIKQQLQRGKENIR